MNADATANQLFPPFSIRLPIKENKLLQQALERINQNQEILTLWNVINVNSIERLGFSDHGPVHVQIVANIALRLTRILIKNKVEMSVVKDFHLTNYHAELIVLLASLFHDLGLSVHRLNHEEYSLFLANPILQEILDFLPIAERTVIKSEVLHAIVSHRRAGHPFTIEGEIVRVADALDMSSGRSRIPFTQGKINIHSLSALAIDKIEIKEGKEKPVEIDIFMTNSAGIFQVDELLTEKLAGSHIQNYIKVKAYIKGKSEKKLITEFAVGDQL